MRTPRVPTTSVLKCFEQVLEEHVLHIEAVEAGLHESPLVLAITFDERERLQPLLDQAIRAEDGLLVVADSFLGSAELDCDVADLAELIAAVQGALDEVNASAVSGSSENLRLVIEDGSASVIGATDYASSSRGQRTLRSILAATFAEDLRSNDLAAFMYPEDALDVEHRAIVWRLLMRLPQLLRRPPHSTIVVVAGDARVDFGLHCSGDPSLRWQLNDTGLHARHGYERDHETVRRLARIDVAAAPLIMLMLGAGASSGYLPMGNDVRDRALGRYMGKTVDRHNFSEVASDFYRTLSSEPSRRLLAGEREAGVEEFVRRLTLERVLREEKHQERRALSSTLDWFQQVHAEAMAQIDDERASGALASDPLARLLAMRRRVVLVTVNFDRVIEAKGGGDVQAFYTDAHRGCPVVRGI